MRFGVRGQNGKRNQSTIPSDALIDTQNIDMSEGIVRGEGGASLYTSQDVGNSIDVLGGIDYAVGTTTQRLVCAFSSGDVKMDAGTGLFPTLLDTGRDTSARTFFSEGGNESQGRSKKLFVANGVNPVLVITGDASSTGDISAAAADWTGAPQPQKLVSHRGRMWAWLNDRIYWSDPDNHEIFHTTTGDAGSISVWPGTGGAMRDAVSYKGRLFLFKQRFIGWLDDSSATTSNWIVEKLTDALGVAGTDCADLIDDDIVFLSPEGGIHLLGAVESFGDVKNSDLSAPEDMNKWIRDNVNFARIGNSTVKYYPNRKQVHVCVPTGNATVPDARIVIDMNGQIPRFHISNRDVVKSMWMYRDSGGVKRPMIGDNDGHVYRLDQSSRTHGLNGAYTSFFQTANRDFSDIDPSLANKRKNFDFLDIKFEEIGGWHIPVEIYIDGVNTQTVSFRMSYGQSELGSFVLGTDVLLGLSGFPPSIRRARIRGSGQFFGIKPISTGDSQEFLLSEARVYFTVADERLSA